MAPDGYLKRKLIIVEQSRGTSVGQVTSRWREARQRGRYWTISARIFAKHQEVLLIESDKPCRGSVAK